MKADRVGAGVRGDASKPLLPGMVQSGQNGTDSPWRYDRLGVEGGGTRSGRGGTGGPGQRGSGPGSAVNPRGCCGQPEGGGGECRQPGAARSRELMWNAGAAREEGGGTG